MKKLQYVSDIHLELRKIDDIPTIQPIDANAYLALCGDIGNPFLPNYKKFLGIHSKLFIHILIVSGNHEYYTNTTKRSMEMVNKEINTICLSYPNITYLNKSKIIIGNTKFIGCTLWSDVSNIKTLAENIMNDYKHIYVTGSRKINLLKAENVISLNKNMKDWIQKQLVKISDKYNKIIILTHHAPSFKMLSHDDIYSPCYGNDMDNLMSSYISHWISGHTHDSIKLDIKGTKCVSNCMGYPGQKVIGFKQDSHILFD